MLKSWLKTFDSKQKTQKALRVEKPVFQRIGRKYRPT